MNAKLFSISIFGLALVLQLNISNATDCNANCEKHFSSWYQKPDLIRCQAEREIACKTGIEACDLLIASPERIQGTAIIQMLHNKKNIPQDVHECYKAIDIASGIETAIGLPDTTVQAFDFIKSLFSSTASTASSFDPTLLIIKETAKQLARCSCKAVDWQGEGETITDLLPGYNVSVSDILPNGYTENVQPKTASYAAIYPDNKTYLIIRPFDGTTFGSFKKIEFSSRDSIRGWNWNGKTASYAVFYPDGNTYLIIRSFDGTTFGRSFQKIEFSSSDSIRGWNWDGKTASYVAVYPGGITKLIIRPFNGTKFGPFQELLLSSSDSVRGWNWDGKTASYIAVYPGGITKLITRAFDGRNFGPFREIILSDKDSMRGWEWQ